MLQQVVLDEGNDAEIAAMARRVESDKAREKLYRRVDWASRFAHRLPAAVQFILRRV
jgi:hypothetical protein